VDAIVVDALEKTYPRNVRALDGIRFSVREGEVFGRSSGPRARRAA
jgi:ABC-type multidrug transport system ATPase subunit